MTIHEFGKEHQTAVVLIHPSVVMWDSFECVVPLLGGAGMLLSKRGTDKST